MGNADSRENRTLSNSNLKIRNAKSEAIHGSKSTRTDTRVVRGKSAIRRSPKASDSNQLTEPNDKDMGNNSPKFSDIRRRTHSEFSPENPNDNEFATLGAQSFHFKSIIPASKIKNTIKTNGQKDFIRNALANNFISSRLNEVEIESIIDAMGIRQVKKGEIIISQDNEGECFYIIANGKFIVHQGSGSGSVIKLSPGTSFGESALLSSSAKYSSVHAETPGLLYTLDRETYHTILYSSRSDLMEKITQTLSEIPMMSALSYQEYETLCRAVEVVNYKANDIIIEKDTEEYLFYIIQQGFASVTNIGSVTEYTQHTLGPGDFFGERAILSGKKRSATVTAVTDLELLVLDRNSFLRIFERHRDMIDFHCVLVTVNNIENLSILDIKTKIKLIKSFQMKSFSAGSMVVQQGKGGERMYIIKEGVVKLVKDEKDVGTLHAGQYFGRDALVYGLRKSSVYAITNCVFYTLSRSAYISIIGDVYVDTIQTKTNISKQIISRIIPRELIA